MSGPRIIITGALGGIGRATAIKFSAVNAMILLVDAAPRDLIFEGQLALSGATKVAFVQTDVADEAQVARAVLNAMSAFGGIDAIVNIAGAMIYKPLVELGAADWRQLLDVNLVGAALFISHGLRSMQRGGAIVNVASVHARRTAPQVAPYAAAKAALVSLTRSAAIEGKALGIRVNAVLPGAVDTPMLWSSPNIRSGAEVVDAADVGQPDDIAHLIYFLTTDAAQFINGEDIVADGGRMGRL